MSSRDDGGDEGYGVTLRPSSFRHDELGNLLGAMLAKGTVVDYSIDGTDRRVGRTVNRQRLQRLLYSCEGPQRLTPVANELHEDIIHSLRRRSVSYARNRHRRLSCNSAPPPAARQSANGPWPPAAPASITP